uniref:Uncharacterized protein n=1 Tax=Rhizophora mucronata TaxID=61149 RepID=A0A2P2JFK0_RHIMU
MYNSFKTIHPNNMNFHFQV